MEENLILSEEEKKVIIKKLSSKKICSKEDAKLALHYVKNYKKDYFLHILRSEVLPGDINIFLVILVGLIMSGVLPLIAMFGSISYVIPFITLLGLVPTIVSFGEEYNFERC